ncbi:MAG: cob(I)yrinic acid a,c-diamide adenosyltransferase [Gammaproteobacteria bacterium]
MGHRLSKIYTRTGDDGTTGLGDGERVPKDHARVEAYGTVDELNSSLGVLLACELPTDIAACLTGVQHTLFDLGGELSVPGYSAVSAEHVEKLEIELDRLNADLPMLKEFILPGGSTSAAACHMARAICRRAERRTATLARGETINLNGLHYLNRLSDLLFVIARVLLRAEDRQEVLWKPGR